MDTNATPRADRQSDSLRRLSITGRAIAAQLTRAELPEHVLVIADDFTAQARELVSAGVIGGYVTIGDCSEGIVVARYVRDDTAGHVLGILIDAALDELAAKTGCAWGDLRGGAKA